LDNTLKIWEAGTGKERATLRGHTDAIEACAVSPDAALIVSASRDKTLKLWSSISGKELGTLVLTGTVLCVAFHPFRPLIVCGDQGGGVNLVDLACIEYHPLVVTGWRRVRVWRLVGLAERKVHARCPACQKWSEVLTATLGRETECANCHQRLKLSPFTINADWRPIAKALRGAVRAAGVSPTAQ
jgi:hypothetical protein